MCPKGFADSEASYDPANNFECDDFEDERATPDITRLTPVEIAEIRHGSTVGRSLTSDIILHDEPGSLSVTSRQHVQFKCFGGLWTIEDLGSASGTIVNGICIQGRRRSSSSNSSKKRSFSTSVSDLHYSFSASMSSSQDSLNASQGREASLPSRLTLRPNEINEIRIGAHRLFITPFFGPGGNPFRDKIDDRYQYWQDLFPSSESFWYCSHCKEAASRVAVAKLAPIICEISACDIEDLEDFSTRKELLKPLGNDDRCLERILAIFNDNDATERPLIAILRDIKVITLEQRLRESKALELCDIKDMLQELLKALALHQIDHGDISTSTISVDDCERVHLRGFMRPARLRRHGQDVSDLFEIFRRMTSSHVDFRFYTYLSQSFISVKHARDSFPFPDATFDYIHWSRNFRIHQEGPQQQPEERYVAIGQICDMLLLTNPSEAASSIDKLRQLRRFPRPSANFDHCVLRALQEAFPAMFLKALPRTWLGQVPVLCLAGYGTFVECSRLRLWADRGHVGIFDREYADYPFLDVVSEEEELNGSYAAANNIIEMARCLGLPEDVFSSMQSLEGVSAKIPKFLFYLRAFSISAMETSEGDISWTTSDIGQPKIRHSAFAKLLQKRHQYPYIFKLVPRALLDDFKSSISLEPPSYFTTPELPPFRFRNRNRALLSLSP